MIRRLIFNPITLIFLTILSIIFSISLHKSAQKTTRSAHNLASVEQEVAQIETEVEQLELALESAEQPLAKEKIIRNELMMQKPGECVIQIADELTQLAASTAAEIKPTPTPWEEWRELLF